MREATAVESRRVWISRIALAAIAWLALWVCLPQIIGVWFLMMVVYLICVGLAGSALALAPSYSARHAVWLAASFRAAEWLILSGLISLPLYVIGFVVSLWLRGGLRNLE